MQHADLGTGRTQDLFVLNRMNQLIDIPVVNLENADVEKNKLVEDIIADNSDDLKSMPESLDIKQMEITEEKPVKTKKFDW